MAKKGNIPWNKGKKGVQVSWNKGKPNTWSKGHPHTKEIRRKLSEFKKKNPTKYWLGKKRPELTGAKHPRWKGGTTKRVMSSVEYKTWRISVFQRDKYTCQGCGQIGYDLQAHHIHSWSKFPLLRFVVDNGVTLCTGCHKIADKKLREEEKHLCLL